MSDVSSVKIPLRILSIGAHPADVFDQSGGTMAHHVARGDWVGCVVLSHGARVHDKVICDETFKTGHVPDAAELSRLLLERGDVKAREVAKACAILGVNEIFFLGLDDAVLIVNESSVRQVARLIRQHRPDIIITHFPREQGGLGAHAETGKIVIAALDLANAPDPGDRNPPHAVAQIFFYGMGAASARAGVWSSEGGFYNDVFVDIRDVVHKKVAALDAMESQGYGGAYARKRMEASDGAFGHVTSLPYAEGFISYRSTIHYHLPLSEYNYKMMRLSNHEQIELASAKVSVP